MVRSRKRTALIAAAWLVCQTLALSVPLAANVIAAGVDICTCPGGTPGAQCPMHHRGMGTATPSPDAPAVRNACAEPDATLLSLSIGLGILPTGVGFPADRTLSFISPIAITPLLRAELPDAPPPRA